MFQFPESRLSGAIYSLQDTRSLSRVGSPIRISTALCMLTAPRRISLFAASFFASLCLGIRHTPFLTLPSSVSLDHFLSSTSSRCFLVFFDFLRKTLISLYLDLLSFAFLLSSFQ